SKTTDKKEKTTPEDKKQKTGPMNLGKFFGQVTYDEEQDYYFLELRGARFPFKTSPIEAQDVLLEAPGKDILEKNTSLLYGIMGKEVLNATLLIDPNEEDEVMPAANDIARYIQIANRKKFAGIAYTKPGGKLEKFAKNHDLNFTKIPSGYSPRFALPIIFGRAYRLTEILLNLHPISYQMRDHINNFDNLENLSLLGLISNSILSKIPIILSDNEFAVLSIRFRSQLNENSKLIANKYVKIEGCDIHIDKNYEFPFNVNFAIEAKLKDWKRALKQAYRYKWFAEYSYVVMDAHYSNSAIKNINVFEKYNVGLATITTTGELKRYYNPTRERPFDQKMQILFSEKIKNNYEFAK
ncbi:hypothetical protein LCGC14_2916450, partial [marine sediment metagenome]